MLAWRTEHNTRPVVLVVEDNRVNRMVARQILKRGDIDTEEAEGGLPALEQLRQNEFDLVLMDVQMPGMDGLEAARAIRRGDAGERNRSIPIVALTAYASPEDEAACYDAGMDDYLSKPLNISTFLETVRQIIEKQRTHPQGPGA